MRVTLTPSQMNRLARGLDPIPKPKHRKETPADIARRPMLAPSEDRETDATAEWLEHIRTGRIPVR